MFKIECVKSVPFQENNTVIETVNQIFEEYVFKDIVQDISTEFHHFQINLTEELNQINQKTFSNDFDFQQSISDIVDSLYDAHTSYQKPLCYNSFTFYFPLQLSIKENQYSNPEVYVSGIYDKIEGFANIYESITGINPRNYIGETIITIDNQDAWDFLLIESSKLSISKDPSCCLNQYLQNDFMEISLGYSPIPEKENRTIQFNSGSVDFPFIGMCTSNFSSQSDFQTQCLSGLNETNLEKSKLKSFEEKERKEFLSPVLEKKRRKQMIYEYFTSQDNEKENVIDGSVVIFNTSNSVNFEVFTGDSGIQYGIFRIITFSPPNQTEFEEILNYGMEYIQSNNIDYLIIDLRQNEGGIIALSYQLFYFFFNLTNSPIYGNYDFRHSSINTQMFTKCAENENCTEKQMFFTPLYWYNQSEQQWTNGNWFDPVTYLRGGEFAQFSTLVHEAPNISWKSPIQFDKNHTILLSDGICGSSCAVFSSKIIQNNLATTFTIGGIPNSEMSFISFPGGQSFYSGGLIEYINILEETYGIVIDNPPTPFESDNELMFTYREIYPFNTNEITNSTIPLEFMFLPTENKLNIWDFSNESLIYQGIDSYLNPTPSPTPNPNQNSSSSGNKKVTIALGVVIPIVFISVIIIVIIIYRKKNKKTSYIDLSSEEIKNENKFLVDLGLI
ncbi:peptidase s41 family protein [Anaeramoeba ignava]|uniref:Peptidase s41 family protein n=1 Tax=Anaeramoeba ignava TaxID=1746090 RepID=A0A9Q0R9A1_ANAIG|nr:peptidase s41 family protein [Anaeramoeba ignava]